MDETITICPNFSIEEAALVLNDNWHINGVLKPLDSYLDQNFLVQTKEGKKYVLKIANVETPENWLDLQHKVLLHLQSEQIPKTVALISGSEMLFYELHWWRVLEFIEGQMLSNVPYHSEKLITNIGAFAGDLSKKMVSFSHPAADRPIQWDLQNASKLILNWIEFVEDSATKETILDIVNVMKRQSSDLANLRKSVIHADLTRYNILLNDAGDAVQGLIDFGDVCWSWTIGELAVLLLESVITGTSTPYSDAYAVVKTYHEIFPITVKEAELLFPLIQLRSALIVCASARQLSLEPDNEYVRKQSVVDLNTFKTLSIEKNAFATALFKEACGFNVSSVKLKKNTHLLLNKECDLPFVAISPISDIYDEGAWNDTVICKKNINKILKNGYGYSEYLTPIIQSFDTNLSETQTVSLGIFVFAPFATTVFAPFDLIFIKQIGRKLIFKGEDYYFNIFGIDALFNENQNIKAGAVLGTVALENENTPYPSHCYVQIDKSGTAPAFCHPSEVKGWELLCENPIFLLGITTDVALQNNDSAHLAERRAAIIQQAQEYYYQKPMNLVRGWKQYLFDENGLMYLDAINNVTHIGHSHPKITLAATNQLKKLNTNARFLYKDNIEYAEKLLSYFPDSLQVVFFTCTGSEANDLALRLARSYTNQNDVIVIDGEYHGNTTAVDEISTCLMDNPTASKSVRSFTHPLIQPNVYRGKYRENEPNVADLYASDVTNKVLAIQSQGRGLAAFISESLLGSGGGVEMPKTYLEKVYQLVRDAGGVCIADEVQIGFGRMGTHFWGFEKEGVVPDIVTLGKPMGNGYPIAAVITTREIADAYKKKYTYFNTYAGNAVACQIASAVLEVIEEEKLQENALKVGQFLKNEFEKLIPEFDCVGAVYGHAMYLGVDIVSDKKTRKPDSSKALLICEAMKKKGIIIYPTGDYYNILKIKPPLCFTQNNAQFLIETIKEIFSILEG
jgi:4-aminobutyrate aminotransferase-like enzyme/Ser/Thr protein kinase RdoA (MazF antagonist)